MPQKKQKNKRNSVTLQKKSQVKKPRVKKASTVKKASQTKKNTIKKNIRAVNKSKTFEELLYSNTTKTNIKKNIRGELLRMKRVSRKRGTKMYTSPYSYIYSDLAQSGKSQKLIRAIENRLTDLDISGRVHKLSQFKNLEEIIEEDIRRGITTIVIIGDDKLLTEAIGAVADLDVVLGIIPIGNKNKIATMLGIANPLDACDILSQRIIENVDIGRVNGRNFFSHIEIIDQKIPLLCDDNYEILSIGGTILIYNLNVLNDPELPNINAKDGKFEVLVRPRKPFGFRFKKVKVNNESLFFAKTIYVSSKASFIIYVDGKKMHVKTLDIEIVPQSLKLIAGRGRTI